MNLEELDAKNLLVLASVTADVLAEDLGEDERKRLGDLPAARAATELNTLLSEAGVPDGGAVVATLTDETDETSRDSAARDLIEEALAQPEASDKIAAAYDQRKSMMVADAGIITGPVLLAIVLLRLKRVRAGKWLDVEFADSKGLGAMFKFLHGVGGGH